MITTICDHTDIWCLTIKHPYVEETEHKDGAAIKASVESAEKKTL